MMGEGLDDGAGLIPRLSHGLFTRATSNSGSSSNDATSASSSALAMLGEYLLSVSGARHRPTSAGICLTRSHFALYLQRVGRSW